MIEGLSADERTDIIPADGADRAPPRAIRVGEEAKTELEHCCNTCDTRPAASPATEFVRLDPQMNVGDALKRIRSVGARKRSRSTPATCSNLKPKGCSARSGCATWYWPK